MMTKIWARIELLLKSEADLILIGEKSKGAYAYFSYPFSYCRAAFYLGIEICTLLQPLTLFNLLTHVINLKIPGNQSLLKRFI